MELPGSAPQPYLGLVLEKLRRVSPGEVGAPGPGVRKRQTWARGSERRRWEVPEPVSPGRGLSLCPRPEPGSRGAGAGFRAVAGNLEARTAKRASA